MKKMRCESCGAKLKVEEGKEYVTCEYCGTDYKLNEASKKANETNEKTGETIQIEATNKKLVLISVIIGFIIIMSITITLITSMVGKESKYDIQKFNSPFTNSAGTEATIFVESTLDRVISSNKEYADKKITVKYNEITTQDEREIINIKQSLKSFSEYEVIVNKDQDGYVSEIIIEDIKKSDEDDEVVESSYNVNMFNNHFLYSEGEKATIFVKSTLQEVISHNEEYENKKITAKYKDITTQDKEKINEIIKSLKENSKYQVEINKDEEGFVCEVIIEEN